LSWGKKVTGAAPSPKVASKACNSAVYLSGLHLRVARAAMADSKEASMMGAEAVVVVAKKGSFVLLLVFPTFGQNTKSGPCTPR
jgi:hypothetical protein